MSTHVIRRTRDPIELLERALNRTTLTTKRVSHNHILGIGCNLLQKTHVDIDGEKDQAVQDALDASERRHTRELRASLHRLQAQLDTERKTALERQKQYYETLAKRVSEQRDRAEEERIKEIKRVFEQEKQEALAAQWDEAERLREQTVKEACCALRHQLRDEFAWEKERAIADALTLAREKFKKREQETIERTREECAKQAAAEAAKVAAQHAAELKKQQNKYNYLNMKYEKELDHKRRVEQDFIDLQADYRRFMDYTDGKFHSDYLMKLRHSGDLLSTRKVSEVHYHDILTIPKD